MKAAPLGPVPVAELIRLISKISSDGVDADLRRELTQGHEYRLKLVGPRDDHPALDLVAEQAAALAEEGSPEGLRHASQMLQRGRTRMVALRSALSKASSLQEGHNLRKWMSSTAIEVEVLGWRLAFELGQALGGPWFDEEARRSFAHRLQADPRGTIKALRPKDDEYRSLKEAHAHYQQLATRGGEGIVVKGRRDRRHWHRLREGLSDERILRLRKRLEAEGFGVPPIGQPQRFDAGLSASLAHLQQRYGLKDHGRIDDQTLTVLGLSVQERAEQLATVLRHRRASRAREKPYRIVVNIPAYELKLFREGRVVARHRVVVGSTRNAYDPARNRRGRLNETPVLASQLGSMVFNPAWYVPRRIKEQEIDRIIERSPSYADRFNFRVDRHGVEWAVQPPGPRNPLGRVKFVFPGGDGVFLHDTPKTSAFNQHRRALSHGCVRVEDAVLLAKALIAHDNNRVSLHRLASILRTRHPTEIRLDQPVPLFIEYVTVSTDAQGQLRFHPDIYGLGTVVAASAH